MAAQQRVAIPVDRDGRTLAHFGITPTMLVVSLDDEGREVGREARPNPDSAHQHPAHHRLVLDLVRDCQVAIASHMGPPMVRSLQHIGARVLRAPAEDAEACLAAYRASLRGGAPLADFRPEEGAPPPGHQPHADEHEHTHDHAEDGH